MSKFDEMIDKDFSIIFWTNSYKDSPTKLYIDGELYDTKGKYVHVCFTNTAIKSSKDE